MKIQSGIISSNGYLAPEAISLVSGVNSIEVPPRVQKKKPYVDMRDTINHIYSDIPTAQPVRKKNENITTTTTLNM